MSVEARFMIGGECIEVVADNLVENRDETIVITVGDHTAAELTAWLRPFLRTARRPE